MLKNRFIRIGAIILMSIAILSFTGDLAYRDVVDGKLKMLIPTDFIRVPKESFKPNNQDDPSPDDFYCNRDTSEYVAFIKLPKHIDDLSQGKQMGQMALIDTANKVHFNDTLTVNGNKVYLLEMDGMDAGKLKSITTFIMNTHDSALLGIISCKIALKKSWSPVSDQMLKSIKLN